MTTIFSSKVARIPFLVAFVRVDTTDGLSRHLHHRHYDTSRRWLQHVDENWAILVVQRMYYFPLFVATLDWWLVTPNGSIDLTYHIGAEAPKKWLREMNGSGEIVGTDRTLMDCTVIKDTNGPAHHAPCVRTTRDNGKQPYVICRMF
jgi:hypothetical protein